MSIALSIPSQLALASGTKLPGYYVDQAWLQDHLSADDLRIVQVGGEKYFDRMHIPGAQLLSYSQIVEMRDGVGGMRREKKALIELFGKLGIGPQTRVVAYDLSGGVDGARLIWTLVSLGHQGGVALLDGGLGRWYEEQRPMAQERHSVAAVEFISQDDDRWEISAEQLLAHTEGQWPGKILDVRSESEYVGMVRQGPRGHIKGAVHLDWSQALRNPRDSRLKDVETLKAQFEKAGLTDPNQEIVVYCETGHRASQSWLLLQELGFRAVRLFDGSISEWRVRDLPVVAGLNPE
ncbi:MAG: sulfurtransferase [Magnetococcales bacterium]|nr:sulfurtransferase [Magnetococcales bacterium]